MSNSYRTERTKFIAARRVRRDKEGRAVLPRVLERAPRDGDCHPLQRRHLQAFLKRLPIDYVFGLNRIELRGRISEVGKPYGYYLPSEKIIVLYSVPPTLWNVPVSLESRWEFEVHGAEVEGVENGVLVHWQKSVDLACFLYTVLLHELGHHYDNQYRTKNKYPGNHRFEEISANRHMIRLLASETFSQWHKMEAQR